MSLPANAQDHLLAAFQARIPADDVIPPDTRYRMFAERVIHRPLPDWRGMTVEEARRVFKRLGGAPPPPRVPDSRPAPEDLLAVLKRVDQRQPLNSNDHAEVVALTRQELMHVTPEFDRTDPCPYRLTTAGQAALRSGTVGA
ncbi:hypothetical protein DESA109040_13860 [Deinococcus saxicola]|uniref:hypothetical protein n=1 Tax=Deinococcus saxicola TaxID=249406 RepID=UPI0039EF4514